ncbi:MAG: DEAD/DEAH box helicase [Anaerolineales bacterium]|nr:DEAD/DEAH box helicase [Anaerolineales bacterium]
MNLHTLFSRADDQSLQTLLGGPALGLILLLDVGLASPGRITDLIFDLYSPQGLVSELKSRNIIVDLLRPDEVIQLARVLGIKSPQNPYDEVKRKRIQKGSALEKALFDYFEVLVPIKPIAPEKDDALAGRAGYSLFPHQREAARKVFSALKTPPRRVVLHMPTGAGKTRTAMNVICEHLREREPGLVVWLAFSEELCEQAAEEFEKSWFSLGNRKVDIFRFWGNQNYESSEGQDGIVIAGLSKLYNAAKKNIRFISQLGNRCTMVIIDEAHSAIAETYSYLLDALVVQHPTTGLLGLTATPGRTWADIDADAKLALFFHQKKVTLQIPGYQNPVDYLTDEGYLAQVDFRPLMHDGGFELTDIDLEKIQNSLDIPDNILVRLAEDRLRNLKIVLEIERLAETHHRIIVFATTVEHSDLLASVLRARGYKANSVTSKSSSYNRELNILDFKKDDDEIRILCNFGVLTTGFDAPKTSAALIARPTKSLVLYSQMVGRAIRGVKAGGNKTAEVVTILDQGLPGFGSVADAFINWEDVWE